MNNWQPFCQRSQISQRGINRALQVTNPFLSSLCTLKPGIPGSKSQAVIISYSSRILLVAELQQSCSLLLQGQAVPRDSRGGKGDRLNGQ